MAAEGALRESPGGSLLEVRQLSKTYPLKRGIFGTEHRVGALDSTSLEVQAGRTLALVGESGSGKSTLARCIVRLEEPDSGEVLFEGRDVLRVPEGELRGIRRKMQLIFQDPASALNPRFAAWEVVAEPLAIEGKVPRKEQRQRALALLAQTGLPTDAAERRPAEFSGGQRQRLAIARALSLEPRLLILDEALSALDLPVQAQIVNLLLDLQEARNLTYLFISHDLALAGYLADEIAVIRAGRIIEKGGAAEILDHPQHPHTRALLAAAPTLDIVRAGARDREPQ